MASYLKDADVIVSAVGKPGLVTKDVVKEGAVIIDVGNTPDEDGKLKVTLIMMQLKKLLELLHQFLVALAINNYYGK